jgi:hypothetical protein
MQYYELKLIILPITNSERWQKIQFPSDHKKFQLLKRTLLRWKPIHLLTVEYWRGMEVSHTVDVFVCVSAGVVSKYFLFQCLLNVLFQIMQVSNVSQKTLIMVWINVAVPKMSCDNLSGEEMYSIHWICPVYVLRSWDMYPCATNDFKYSDGFTHRLWWISAYFFIGLKVVVYLPSKDIVGHDVTLRIFLSWMIILRHEIVHTFMQPRHFSYCAYLTSCS